MQDREESEEGNAALAFEHLTDEVSALKHQVEELVDALQLKETPDYSPSLGEIAQGLHHVVGRLETIEQHPALKLSPAQFAEAIERAGGRIMREAAHQLDGARRATDRTSEELRAVIGSAREQDRQTQWLLAMGAAALLVGLLISPILARLLPFGLNARVAAAVMATDRWNAGAALMEAQSPEAWNELAGAGELVGRNAAAIGACRAVAVKARQSQRCTIEVPPDIRSSSEPPRLPASIDHQNSL